jgi:hypothetical protein
MIYYVVPFYFLLWAVGAALDAVYQQRLRRLYPELAARLHPGWFRKGMANDLSATRFLLRGDFRRLDNRAFVRFCEVYRALMFSFFAVFMVTLALFVAGT